MIAHRLKIPDAILWAVLFVFAPVLAFALPEPYNIALRLPWAAFEAQGSLQAIGIAAVAAVVYWLALPAGWRMVGLLLISVSMPLLIGASPSYILLVVTLALMAHGAASRPVETKTPTRRATLNFLYVIYFTSLLALATINAAVFTAPVLAVVTLSIATLVLINAIRFPTLTIHIPEITLVKYAVTAYLLAGLIAQAQHMKAALPMGVELYGTLACLVALLYATPLRRLLGKAVVIFLLATLIILKAPGTMPIELVGWVGFSYLAFRLMHVVLDSVNGQYTDASPAEMVLYTLFFPALLVGPIDRLPRFLQDRRCDSQPFDWSFAVDGTLRIMRGCAKKFFLADVLLAPVALGITPTPAKSTAFAWIQLYAYAFYILSDFSGYVDIALGSARLLGYNLPENFNMPYLKSNISEFWQSWHITLSNWLRTYVFIPISRRLMQTRLKRWPLLVVFSAQMVTMILIGLWHGLTFHFALWGAWHGTGLFIHKVYSDRTRRYYLHWKQAHPLRVRLLTIAGALLTFHFVLLGWVFFALPRLRDAWRFFVLLMGFRS